MNAPQLLESAFVRGLAIATMVGCTGFVALDLMPVAIGKPPSVARASTCRVVALPPRHLAPQGVAATASLRCSRPEKDVSFEVDAYNFAGGRLARQRARLAPVVVGHAYILTASTRRCVSSTYRTFAWITVGGQRSGWRSPISHIDCNLAADNRCDVVAGAPSVSNGQVVGPASFTCISDQSDLIWNMTVQLYDGSWEDRGFSQGFFDSSQACQLDSSRCAANSVAVGGHTYNESAKVPCSGVPPGSRKFRTVIKVRRVLGPPITTTSTVASLTCPSPPVTLTVRLSGGGTGTVTSSPAGIDCGQTCSHAFSYGTQVTLTATAAAGSNFLGWKLPPQCSGTGTCVITLDSSWPPGAPVTADFELK